MTPTNQHPISDDQELAKVLAGVNQEANEAAAAPVVDEPVTIAPTNDDTTDDTLTPIGGETVIQPLSSQAEEPSPAPMPDPVSSDDDSLDTIKSEAIHDLRPLVDKLNIVPEEKFDTLLLLLRSTDDKTLIPSAYDAARGIADESRRAQALLDVIKEIDYLSSPKQ